MYRFNVSPLSNWLIVTRSEVCLILSKLNENEFCSCMSPPKNANDWPDMIGINNKTEKNNTILNMI